MKRKKNLLYGSLRASDTRYNALFERNIGLFTTREQRRIRNATVAIAGIGGVGGLLAERLIRLGVGTIKLSDPGRYEASNCNRQLEATVGNFGRNKARVVGARLREINPEADVFIDTRGIHTQDDAVRFTEGATLVIDDMDFGLFEQAIRLQRAARGQGAHYMFSSAFGFGAMVVCFKPRGTTLEEFNGLPRDADISGGHQPVVPTSRILPDPPAYARRKAGILKKVLAGKMAAPTNSIGVGLASILTANEALNVILSRKEAVFAPAYVYIDLRERFFRTGKVPKACP